MTDLFSEQVGIERKTGASQPWKFMKKSYDVKNGVAQLRDGCFLIDFKIGSHIFYPPKKT